MPFYVEEPECLSLGDMIEYAMMDEPVEEFRPDLYLLDLKIMYFIEDMAQHNNEQLRVTASLADGREVVFTISLDPYTYLFYGPFG